MTMKKNSGLTLIETIIVIFLFSIVLASIYNILTTSRFSWKSASSQLTVQQEARRGLNTMLKELRQARLSTISGVPVDGMPHSSITFQIPESITESGVTWSSNIQYSLGGLNSAQLIRTQDSGQRVLANNISILTFDRSPSSPDTITINIATQKNIFENISTAQSSINLDSAVKVRNQ